MIAAISAGAHILQPFGRDLFPCLPPHLTFSHGVPSSCNHRVAISRQLQSAHDCLEHSPTTAMELARSTGFKRTSRSPCALFARRPRTCAFKALLFAIGIGGFPSKSDSLYSRRCLVFLLFWLLSAASSTSFSSSDEARRSPSSSSFFAPAPSTRDDILPLESTKNHEGARNDHRNSRAAAAKS